MAFLRTLLDKDPGNAEALVLMGSTHLIKNAPEEAQMSFEQAIARQPKKTIGQRALADLHLRQKRTDEALKVIQLGLQAPAPLQQLPRRIGPASRDAQEARSRWLPCRARASL